MVHCLATSFCIAAAVISLQLLNKHIGGAAVAKWFDAGCSESVEAGSANCAAVLASPYSYFPARKPDAQGGGLPVALLGLVYYSVLTFWLIGVGRPSRSRRWWHAVPLLLVGFGLAMSAYYVRVMFKVLDQWCPWCAVTHGLNLGIAVCLVLMWPRRVQAGASAAPSSHLPSGRVVLLTILAGATLVFAEVNMLAVKNYKRRLHATTEQLNTVMKRLSAFAPLMVRMWEANPKLEFTIRSDEPIRVGAVSSDGPPPLDLVVFSDFECPSCARFAAMFETSIAPMFANRVRTTFKHYPIDQSCNARAGRTLHPNACLAAAIAEAARKIEGNEGFWKAHDYLFKHRDELATGQITFESAGAALRLDAAAWKALAGGGVDSGFQARIGEDIQQARMADIRGTPAVFIEGRLVDTLAAGESAFWDRLAEWYWQRAGVPRPDSTRPKPTTPSNPTAKGAP